MYPKITIGIINSRNNKYFDSSLESAKRILYPQIDKVDIKVCANYKMGNNKIVTIGEAFNGLANSAEGKWIFYLGDDDMVSRTTLFNYAIYLLTYAEYNPKIINDVVCVTGNMILFDDTGKRRQHLQCCPTGLWNIEYIKKNPFDEKLKRWVDTEMFTRSINNKKIILYAATDYGYYYRQHANNISGNKFIEKTKVLKEIISRNKEQMLLGGINE